MDSLKLLIVEDSEEDIETCRDTLETFNDENGTDISAEYAKTASEALEFADGGIEYDGIVIDLRLGDDPSAGQDVMINLSANYKRSPIVVFSGTPDNLGECNPFRVFKKGEHGWDEIFKYFIVISKIGIRSILGQTGIIETKLWSIYSESLRKRIHIWVAYAAKHPEEDVKRALLRYVINHLNCLLDDDLADYYPEEFYVEVARNSPPTTGTIVSQNAVHFLVVSPACDLVIRDDRVPKSDRVQLVAIDDPTRYVKNKDGKVLSDKDIKRMLNNSASDFLHYLPDVSYPEGFHGGFANFRNVVTVEYRTFSNEFTATGMQVAPSFVKDIVARFSRYYGRQGQPELLSDEIIERVKKSL